MGPLAGVAAGWLIASLVSWGVGFEGGPGPLQQLLVGGAVFVVVVALHRYRASRAQPARGVVAAPSAVTEPPPGATTGDPPRGESSLDEGIRDIRRMDARFDPARFTGYIETVFRDTHSARVRRDVASVRDRITPALYGELQAQCDRWRSLGHAIFADPIEIRAEVTEAWHEDGWDYVTAYIAGTMLAYTVDEATGALVHGSKSVPDEVEAFWTFTRPAGLNPWMLAAIQPS